MPHVDVLAGCHSSGIEPVGEYTTESVMHCYSDARPMVTLPAKEHCHCPCSFPTPLRVGGWVGLGGLLHTKTVYPQTVYVYGRPMK